MIIIVWLMCNLLKQQIITKITRRSGGGAVRNPLIVRKKGLREALKSLNFQSRCCDSGQNGRSIHPLHRVVKSNNLSADLTTRNLNKKIENT